MSDFANEFEPRNLITDMSTKLIYKELQKIPPFKDKYAPNKDIFILSMALGFAKGRRIPIKNPYSGHVNYKSLFTEERWLLRAIAISEKKDLNVLSGNNQREIFKIVAEYANGGIKLLYQEMKGNEFGDFIKRLENKLIYILQKSKKG